MSRNLISMMGYYSTRDMKVPYDVSLCNHLSHSLLTDIRLKRIDLLRDRVREMRSNNCELVTGVLLTQLMRSDNDILLVVVDLIPEIVQPLLYVLKSSDPIRYDILRTYISSS